MSTPPTPASALTSQSQREDLSSGGRNFVQLETNLLRFPFFSLQTKGLRDVDFKEVRGTRTENGQSHEFVFRVSRNTDLSYPGPLSRKVHFALLNLLRKQGFPSRNPIAFTWRQLAREMGISFSGSTTIDRLREAIRCTQGAFIQSTYALKSGSSRTSLPVRERGYSLYAEILFANEETITGAIADRNFVKLADWYLENLNDLYSVPVDYDRWTRLNDQSPLASRLYEFLLFSFATGDECFVINYPKLCQFLPAKVEPYASLAKKQLEPAFALLQGEGIIRSVDWGVARTGEVQLEFARGDRLSFDEFSPITRMPENEPETALYDVVTTTEGVSSLSPAGRLIERFYAEWKGEQGRVGTQGELDAARECLEKYGFEQAVKLLPRVVKRLKEQFPDAKTFGATRSYFEEVHAEYEKRNRVAEGVKEEHLASHAEDEERKLREERHARLEPLWEALSEGERSAIEERVISRNTRLNLEKLPGMLRRLCLDELERCSEEQASVAQPA